MRLIEFNSSLVLNNNGYLGSHTAMKNTPMVESIYVCIIIFELFLMT